MHFSPLVYLVVVWMAVFPCSPSGEDPWAEQTSLMKDPFHLFLAYHEALTGTMTHDIAWFLHTPWFLLSYLHLAGLVTLKYTGINLIFNSAFWRSQVRHSWWLSRENFNFIADKFSTGILSSHLTRGRGWGTMFSTQILNILSGKSTVFFHL